MLNNSERIGSSMSRANDAAGAFPGPQEYKIQTHLSGPRRQRARTQNCLSICSFNPQT